MDKELELQLQEFSLEGDYLRRLGVLTDQILKQPNPEEALEGMFGILERYPDEELGSPGPLVHAIEKCSGYEEALFESLKRQPSTLTVWMLHRLIKYDPKPRYVEILRAVIRHPNISEQNKEDAEVVLSWIVPN
ncbi:MAG: hypothetical protein AAGG81_01850 [Chlamydiota bacterium]